MMDALNWILLVGSALLLVVIVSYLVVMAIKNNWISEIHDTLSKAIKEAEEKYQESGSGELKKKFVLDAIEAKCKELKIPYNILKKVVSQLINTIVSNYNIIAK